MDPVPFGRAYGANATGVAPPMLIQPILENALHYGGKTSTMPLKVDVTAKVTEGWLEVVVADSGRWVAPDPPGRPPRGSARCGSG